MWLVPPVINSHALKPTMFVKCQEKRGGMLLPLVRTTIVLI